MLGGSPTVVMACGGEHTLVLMSCDFGHFGQLGHGDETDQLVLMLVAEMEFKEAQSVIVAAGGYHSVALGVEGRVWMWGWKSYERNWATTIAKQARANATGRRGIGWRSCRACGSREDMYQGRLDRWSTVGLGQWSLWPVGPGRLIGHAGTGTCG